VRVLAHAPGRVRVSHVHLRCQEREAKKRAALQAGGGSGAAAGASGGAPAGDAKPAAGDAGGARKKARPAPKAPVLSFDADEGEDA
jgi:hypothetical protein